MTQNPIILHDLLKAKFGTESFGFAETATIKAAQLKTTASFSSHGSLVAFSAPSDYTPTTTTINGETVEPTASTSSGKKIFTFTQISNMSLKEHCKKSYKFVVDGAYIFTTPILDDADKLISSTVGKEQKEYTISEYLYFKACGLFGE